VLTTRPPRDRGLADELRLTFRALLTGLAGVAVVLAGLSATLLGYVQPDLRADTDLIRSLRLHHETMLDRESAIQGWLATGDERYLDLAEAAGSAGEEHAGGLLDRLGRHPRLDRLVLQLQLEGRTWQELWAGPVTELDPTQLTRSHRDRIFTEGRERFDRYREVQATTTELASLERDAALTRLHWVIAGGFTGTVVVVLAVAHQATRQRRRLDQRLSAPLASLISGMEAITRGEPTELAQLDGPRELRTLALHLDRTGARVREQVDALEVQRAESEASAATLASILTVAREIAGSLSVRYVAATVATAAADIAPCERALIWLTSDGTDFVAVHDTSLDHGTTPLAAPVQLGSGAVGTVARDAKPQVIDGSACFPLVVGGRVMGVLELAGSASLGATVHGSLETLATHAAAALEAARLHRATEELAQVDPLTQLLNRRRLDEDLATELDRANRYGRPLGFVMLDLDRFKLLNDTFGHQHGDEVLRLAAECLATAVRNSDTVYRYGGEEFAVLVREGTRTACLELAERLRTELTATFAQRDGFTPLTASFGVAVAPENGRTAAELVLAADGALYAAKAAGRDRIASAPLDGTVTLPAASS
jgi:diguanylate cyclase (GGDEF)-like protein